MSKRPSDLQSNPETKRRKGIRKYEKQIDGSNGRERTMYYTDKPTLRTRIGETYMLIDPSMLEFAQDETLWKEFCNITFDHSSKKANPAPISGLFRLFGVDVFIFHEPSMKKDGRDMITNTGCFCLFSVEEARKAKALRMLKPSRAGYEHTKIVTRPSTVKYTQVKGKDYSRLTSY